MCTSLVYSVMYIRSANVEISVEGCFTQIEQDT
jgi:hypothetical protein